MTTEQKGDSDNDTRNPDTDDARLRAGRGNDAASLDALSEWVMFMVFVVAALVVVFFLLPAWTG
jgi:hypothetical protein